MPQIDEEFEMDQEDLESDNTVYDRKEFYKT